MPTRNEIELNLATLAVERTKWDLYSYDLTQPNITITLSRPKTGEDDISDIIEAERPQRILAELGWILKTYPDHPDLLLVEMEKRASPA
jgi:hypothetical protein